MVKPKDYCGLAWLLQIGMGLKISYLQLHKTCMIRELCPTIFFISAMRNDSDRKKKAVTLYLENTMEKREKQHGAHAH